MSCWEPGEGEGKGLPLMEVPRAGLPLAVGLRGVSWGNSCVALWGCKCNQWLTKLQGSWCGVLLQSLNLMFF